ncbi:MAG: Piwi domain-containing protein [Chitinophagales bacterium]
MQKEFGFSREKKEGYTPIHRALLPQSMWEEFNEELHDIKHLYTNYSDTVDCDYVANIDFYESLRFAKHYYTRLVYEYIRSIADAIKLNYVKDIEVWMLDHSIKNTKYKTYNKYTLKIEFSRLTKSPALLLSYDGVSKVATTSIDEINIPTHYFKTVIYNGAIQKYDKLSEDAKQHLDEVYPLLNINIKNHLEIPHTVPKKGNRYKQYFKLMSAFYNTYLNTDEFRAILPLDENGFYNIPKEDIHQTHYKSNNLRFYDNVGIDPKQGMKRPGPYKASPHNHVSFFFIYHKVDREAYVVPLYGYFENGYKTFFPPLKKHIRQPFHMDKDTSLAFDSPETALKELKHHLINLEKQPNTRYVAVYVSPIHKEDEDNKHLYYQVKEELLKHDITSQVIYKESINNDYFGAFLENITPALLAKIDGIPWRLDRELKQELIVGVGAFKSMETNTRFVGSAFCFNNKGEFKGFDCFRDNEFDLIAGAIGKQILKFVVDNDNKAERLIIHYYKPISKDEIDPIQQTLSRLKLDIPIVIVTINKTESSDYVAFDTNDEALMPLSGTIIEVARLKYLLYNNTRYSAKGFPIGYPFPVKLQLYCTEKGYFEDITIVKELIDQVYQFSRMYWKSVKQQNLPVTIKYPEMVAQIFPHFEGDKLPDFGKTNLWFL